MATLRKRKRAASDTHDMHHTHGRWIHPEDSCQNYDEELYLIREKLDFALYENELYNLHTNEKYVLVYGCTDSAAIYQKLEAPGFGIDDPSIEDIV